MGSIQKRGKNTYLLTVSSGFGLNGKRKRYSKTIKIPDNKLDSEDKIKQFLAKSLAQFENEIESGSMTSVHVTFGTFAVEWLEKYAKKNLRKKTYARYKQLLDLRILPAFGTMKLSQIQPLHIIEFYQNIKGTRLDGKEGSLSDQTVKHHHRLLSTMLTYAVKWQLIKENPALRVDAPRAKKAAINFYDESEILNLINAINGEPLKYRLIILLAIYTGMRRSEVLGISWNDVDLNQSTLSLKQSSQYVTEHGKYIDELKNDSSVRKIAIPEFFKDMFKLLQWQQETNKKHLLEADSEYKFNELNLVFIGDEGNQIFPDTITKWLNKFIKRFNKSLNNNLSIPESSKTYLPQITFHGLRHSHASILIAQNLDILTISKRLGHAETSTTLDIYGHLLKDTDRVATEKFENVIKNSEKKSQVSTKCQQGTKKASD